MKYFFRLACAIILSVLLVACGQTLSLYEGQGFSIRHPQGWTVRTVDKAVLITISHADRNLKRVDGTLTVTVQPLNNEDFAALQKANEETLKNTSVNLNFQTDRVKVNNQDTTLWKYERTGTDNKKTFFRQAMVTGKGLIYTITALGEESVSVSDLEESIKSFSFPN